MEIHLYAFLHGYCSYKKKRISISEIMFSSLNYWFFSRSYPWDNNYSKWTHNNYRFIRMKLNSFRLVSTYGYEKWNDRVNRSLLSYKIKSFFETVCKKNCVFLSCVKKCHRLRLLNFNFNAIGHHGNLIFQSIMTICMRCLFVCVVYGLIWIKE